MCVEGLEAGAFDFVLKEENGNRAGTREVLARRLLPKIRSFSAALYSRRARKLSGSAPRITRPISAEATRKAIEAVRNGWTGRPRYRPEVVVIGVSTGGPEALSHLVPSLPDTLPVPVVIVQHMPGNFTASLAAALDRRSRIVVREGEHGDVIRAGTVYVAPGGTHTALGRDAKRNLILTDSDAPPENGFRPSVDVLFRSAAKACRGAVVAVILTGMGDDGALGLGDLKREGAFVLAQDEETSVVWGMPGRAVRSGFADEVLPIEEIGPRLIEQVTR